jgi:hypothetical protein
VEAKREWWRKRPQRYGSEVEEEEEKPIEWRVKP